MDIHSFGQMTPESIKKLICYISKNEKLFAETSKLAKSNLPEFITKAFDLPPENTLSSQSYFWRPLLLNY